MQTPQDDTLLIFRIDCIPCAVAAASVQSIVMPPAHLTQPPGSDKGRPGIFRHAGHVFAVVDLHQRFGIDTPRKGAGRLLLYTNGMRRHALWVDEVVGLARSEEGKWAQLPPYLPQSLFHSGFLYHDEIVLCSTLDALLAMHDAAPIHLHLEKLRRAQQPAQPTEKQPAEPQATATAKPAAEPPATPVAGAHDTDGPAETKQDVTPPAAAKAPPPTIAKRPRPAPVTASKKRAVRPATPPNRTTASQARSTIVTKPVARPAPLPAAVQSPPPQERAVTTATASATTTEPGNHTLLWLVLFTLLLGTGGAVFYLLQGETPKKRPEHPPHTVIVQPTEGRPLETAPPAPEPEPRPEPATETMAANEVVVPPEVPAESGPATIARTGAALQIGRDEEGTIQLIIERKLLRPTVRNPQPPPELAEEIAEVTSSTPATGSRAAELAPDETAVLHTQEDLAEEPPLLPEADWPQPASLPEPCDCTHIVVKGDTLWDIAQQYTNNAFNYPELARQSGIRNPHRIYPGDKVRIIVR